MSDVLERPADPPDAVVRYASHDEGIVDVFVPDTDGPHGLLVFLHGGFWRTRWDRRHTRPLANALKVEGLVVATPEYRRGPGSWAAMRDDVLLSVSSLPRILEGLGVPVDGVVVAGHSAGGHLALWLANEPVPVDRAVGLAPVADLAFADEHRLGDDAARDMLAGAEDADPAQRFVDRPAIPVQIVHGTDDVNVPVESSRGLTATFSWIDLTEIDGADHFALIDPLSQAWTTVRATLVGRPA